MLSKTTTNPPIPGHGFINIRSNLDHRNLIRLAKCLIMPRNKQDKNEWTAEVILVRCLNAIHGCALTNNSYNETNKCTNRLISITNLMYKFFYSITICMFHYNPRYVSRINMPIFRRTNCIIIASGIVTLCTVQYSMPDESRLLCSLLSSGILYSRLQRVTIPDAVIMQFVLLKMGMLMLETCRGL